LPVIGTMTSTVRVSQGASRIAYSSAPEARPVGSSTRLRAGTCFAPRWATAMPASKVDTKACDGNCLANTRARPSTDTVPPSMASAWIGLTPPRVLRNWLGGLTWNGRIASARV